MNSRVDTRTYLWPALILIFVAMVAAAFWGNLQLLRSLPPESEFIHRWEVTQQFLFAGENPYKNSSLAPLTAPLP